MIIRREAPRAACRQQPRARPITHARRTSIYYIHVHYNVRSLILDSLSKNTRAGFEEHTDRRRTHESTLELVNYLVTQYFLCEFFKYVSFIATSSLVPNAPRVQGDFFSSVFTLFLTF